MSTAKRVTWVVRVSFEDDDPETYGPYTERQAERLAARLVTEVPKGGTVQPGDIRFAIAMPLLRWED